MPHFIRQEWLPRRANPAPSRVISVDVDAESRAARKSARRVTTIIRTPPSPARRKRGSDSATVSPRRGPPWLNPWRGDRGREQLSQLIPGSLDSPAKRPDRGKFCAKIRRRLAQDYRCRPTDFLDFEDWAAQIA